MKRIFRNILPAVVAALSLVACEEDLGTNVGSDGKPAVTLYTYEASAPYNADNDIHVRAVGNNKVDEIYFLAVKSADIEGLTDDELTARVLEQGTKVDTELDTLAGSPIYDDVVTDLTGLWTLATVGKSGNSTSLAKATFFGLVWDDVVTGQYTFGVLGRIGLQPVQTTLQVCTTDDHLMRFKDVYSTGSHLQIRLLNITAEDEDGDTYRLLRVPTQTTPFSYGSYGTISVRDVGYWQGDDGFVTSATGFESGMYDDYSCFITVQAFVSVGSLGYDYDFFIPD